MNVLGMKGLGDNIYQRAFVKNLRGPVWLETPWPELYSDLPEIHFVKPATKLRTQAKNINRRAKWERFPQGRIANVGYGRTGIIAGMAASFRVAPATMDLPNFGDSPVAGPYVVVRPVTVRAEWRADTRNPLPEYIAAAAAALRAKGFKVVSVADLEEDKEWALDPMPVADVTYHKGELKVDQLLALLCGAAAVVGGIGWIVPACLAAKVPAFIVCGGQGGFNAPELITDPSMDLSGLEFVVPDNFCRCVQKIHNCNKEIAGYDKRLADWVERLSAVV